MLGAMPLSRPKPPQAGAEGRPLQGHSSWRQLPPKVSGPPLGAASTLGRRAKSTASAWEIHPLKIQKSRKSDQLVGKIQQRYGIAREEAERQLADLERS